MKNFLYLFVLVALLLSFNVAAMYGGNERQQSHPATAVADVPANSNHSNDSQLLTPEADADKQNSDNMVDKNSTYVQTEKHYSSPKIADAQFRDNSVIDADNTETVNLNLVFCGISVLLLISMVAFAFVVFRRLGKLEKLQRDYDDNEANDDIKSLRHEVRVLTEKIKNQQTINNDLSKRIEKLTTMPDANPGNNNANLNAVSSPQKKPVIYYANVLKEQMFPKDYLQESCDDYTIFILSVLGNEGTYKVNDAKNVQSSLISTFTYSVANAVDVKSKNNAPKTIVTIKQGRIKQTEAGWSIVEKAVVELR